MAAVRMEEMQPLKIAAEFQVQARGGLHRRVQGSADRHLLIFGGQGIRHRKMDLVDRAQGLHYLYHAPEPEFGLSWPRPGRPQVFRAHPRITVCSRKGISPGRSSRKS